MVELVQDDFAKWFDRFGFLYFTARELLVNTDKPGNTLPPRALWGNILPTLAVLQLVRAILGEPVGITSCYRSETYNASVTGSLRSQHRAFTAIDFQTRQLDRAWGLLYDLAHGTAVPREDARLSFGYVNLPFLFEPPPARTPLDQDTPWRPLRLTSTAYTSELGVPGYTWPTAGDFWAFRTQGALGIGRYDTFLHVDTRGVLAEWDLREEADA